MAMDIEEVASLLARVGFEPIRHGSAVVEGLSSFGQSQPNSVLFWKHPAPPTPEQFAALSADVLVLALTDIAGEFGQRGIAALGLSDPRCAFAVVSAHLHPSTEKTGIHPTAIIDPKAAVHSLASIGAGSVVGAGSVIGSYSSIGNYCVIHPGVVIEDRVEIGDLTVVGASGFGYVTLPNDEVIRIPHTGNVRIQRGAHIGSHVAIDRGTIDDTIIGENVRIDNLVHIAHNVRIGSGAMVIAGAEVSGGVTIGEGAWIAPQVAIREQLSVGEGAVVGIGSVVIRDVHPGATVAGVPARELP